MTTSHFSTTEHHWRDVEYSSSEGFKEIAPDPNQDEKDLKTWLAASGFGDRPWETHGPGLMFDEAAVEVYMRQAVCHSPWLAVVVVNSVNTYQVIMVRSHSDLVDLRIKLAPVVCSAALEYLVSAKMNEED